jgi:hypothetical protein
MTHSMQLLRRFYRLPWLLMAFLPFTAFLSQATAATPSLRCQIGTSADKRRSHRAGPQAVSFGIADELSLAQIEL